MFDTCYCALIFVIIIVFHFWGEKEHLLSTVQIKSEYWISVGYELLIYEVPSLSVSPLESQNISYSFSCAKQSGTGNILSKYLSKRYAFSQLGLSTKIREVLFQQQTFWELTTTLIKQIFLTTARSFGSHGETSIEQLKSGFEGNSIYYATICWQ